MNNMTVSLAPHARVQRDTRSIMLDVLIALVPAGVMGVWIYGLWSLAIIAAAVISAILSEIVGERMFGRKADVLDGSAAVTGLLLAYCLPPTVPLWIPIIGSAIAIILVKQLFGGLGHNFVNPALAARGVLMASWPVIMTVFSLPIGAAAVASATPDAVSFATPIALSAAGAAMPSYAVLLMGQTGGCIGEVGRIGLIIGAAYLLIRRVINWHIPAAFLGGSAVMVLALGGMHQGNPMLTDPIYYMLTGAVLLGALFMATDYVTSPATPWGRIVYGLGCAIVLYVIRTYAAMPGGVSYAILLMNIATPLIERFTKPKVYGRGKRRAA